MMLALLVALALTGPISADDSGKDCEVEECSTDTLRSLWLAERGAREEWEKTAAAHALVLRAVREDLADTQTMLAAVRSARLAESAPAVADRGLPPSCLWLAAGSFAAGALAGGGAAVLALDMGR